MAEHTGIHPDHAAAWNVGARAAGRPLPDSDTRLIAARVLIAGLADTDRFANIEEHLSEIREWSQRQADAMVQLVRLAEELTKK